MRRLRRPSVRLWQTELFVIVIVVAILILSVSLSEGLTSTLRQLGEGDRLSDVSALAAQIGPEFPLTTPSRTRLREHLQRFRLIYGDSVWLYDIAGGVVESVGAGGPPAGELARARAQGLTDAPPYSHMDLVRGGYSVAAKAVYDPAGRRVAVVVIAEPVTRSLAVLDAVRDRLWTTFWVALIVSGLLGLGFAEFIGRRVRRMTEAAAAIAGGDFDQQLPTGLIPDEIYELAESYNRMAIKLGEAFAALHDREREIAAVVESMGEGVVAFDTDGAVRVINPEAMTLLAVEGDRDGLPGVHVSVLTGSARIVEMVEACLAGQALSDTVVLGDRTVLAHCTPLATEGAPGGAVTILSDVTERMRLEDAQRRFVANASHEMRTPIAALKGLLELLTGGAKNDPEVRDDFLHTMSLEVDRLGRLVADMLTLAQLEAGTLTVRPEAVPVRDLLDEVATVMRPLADRSGVALVIEAPADASAMADRDRIMQVLLGFVDNALKHSSAGETVSLTARPRARRITFEVRDQGAGIDAEAIAHLFDRFYRADESRSAPRGTGLGLAIAKEIVEAHDSSIEVESRPGEGAAFRFDLPAAP